MLVLVLVFVDDVDVIGEMDTHNNINPTHHTEKWGECGDGMDKKR